MSRINTSEREDDSASGRSPILGDSEVARLIRGNDWKETALGPVSDWSLEFLAVVNAALYSPVPMFLYCGRDCVTLYNDAAIPIVSGKHPVALGWPTSRVFAEAWNVIGPEIDAVLQTGTITRHQGVLVPLELDGKLQDLYWDYSYSPIFESDRITGVLCVCQNVTATVLAMQADAARRLSDERLRAFTVATNNALYQMSADWSVMYQLDGGNFLANTDSADSEWLSKYIHPLDQPQVLEAIQQAIETKTIFELEHRVLRSDGGLGWTFSRAIPLLNADGKIANWFGAASDITDRKLIEGALRQKEKLAAVGQIASTVAHEINNPLESVTNLLYLARSSSNEPTVVDYLGTAEIELKRIAAITRQTLRFHKQQSNPTETRPSALFASTLSIYQGRIQNASIRVEFDNRTDELFRCLEGEIQQVVNNLIGNAIDAMRTGGTLRLRSRRAQDPVTERSGMRLTVADTGTGISSKVIKEIFQPFFTTKGFGGTGLGLWVSAEIAERHAGSIRVRSSNRDGRSGSVFSLFLPDSPA